MLENWLSPVFSGRNETVKTLSKDQFGRNIAIYLEEVPDLKKTDVAIIGLSAREADEVRKNLYTLDYPFDAIRVADLGNIRNEDSSFIIPLVKELLQGNILPIIIGNNCQQSYAQFQAYNTLKRSTNLVCIDERISYQSSPGNEDSYYLNNILKSDRSNLFNLGVVGFQSHFTSDDLLKMMDENYFDYIRLGKLRDAFESVEPVIRDADMLCFNLAALKQSEAPGVQAATPSGLFSEDACRLSRYAGISDKLTSIGFYGLRCEKDRDRQTVQIVSQLIWYFLDGFYNRLGDFPATMQGLTEYIVTAKNQVHPNTFWKSSKSGRWWMQIPVETETRNQRHQLLPCTYEDYQLASNGEYPDRLLNAYKRFS